MDDIQQLKEEIAKLKERNARVDMNKAWEMSLARKILIAILTYIVVVLFFLAADLPKPFINPIVPTVGFILSTLSIPLFRKWWERGR